MSVFLILCVPLLLLGALAVNAAVVLKGKERIQKAGLSLVRRLHSRAEAVDFWGESSKKGAPSCAELRPWIQVLTRTKLGIWGILSSILFLVLWLIRWVSPAYPLGFLEHFFLSWLGGILLSSAAFAVTFSFPRSITFLRAQLFAEKTGLRRIWIARGGKAGSKFGEALRDAFAGTQRIEILDFTGFELLAKGPTEEGGPVAVLLERFPEKEVRILLFDPTGSEIDPDRKHTTVIQSQLVAMEMTREAFQTKLIATLNRIKNLNRNRPKPIDVRLYGEKPSFRILTAGETAFMGSIDPRDGTGEMPMYEVRKLSEEPSLHAAARAHFIRLWGDAAPLAIDSSAGRVESKSSRVKLVVQEKSVA